MIVVLGASGQLGFELHRKLQGEAKFLSRQEADLAETNSTLAMLEKLRPTWIINAAAYTAVDKAESEKDSAFTINAHTPSKIAEFASKTGAKFTSISTDYVHDGKSITAYVETDPVSPVNVYGESKAEGERLILKNNPNALILRTSWVYSSHGKNFVKTILKLGNERESLGIVNDQIGSLTWAADLADVVLQTKDLSGIYNYSSEGVSSWYDVAFAIKHFRNFKADIKPIISSEYPTPAKRPQFSLLNKNKIKQALNIRIPHWMESLEKCLKELS